MRYARELFAPLGAVVAVGALNATGTWSFADVSVGAFLAGRRREWDRLFAAVCQKTGTSAARARSAGSATGGRAGLTVVGVFQQDARMSMTSGAVSGMP
ncbi:hypothetical protein ACWCYL_16845 [Streptomyces sp. 900105755]|uniref:hypothetical protein n=1 Tax=Streptomyces sp. 900105755 TaxID=3154389 RepID=UPI003325D163